MLRIMMPQKILINQNKKILFVHIPKNGGTSILNKLNQSMWIKTFPYGHDPLFVLEQNNNINNIFSFCVVRNPYKRTFSYFIHFKKINNLECSFIEFLFFLKKKKYFPLTPMIIFPQSFYIYNLKGQIGINKIYKHEKFYELENDLNLNLNILNKGCYLQTEYEKNMKNKNCVNLIRELFSIDFINFNYDLDDV